jgi:hypothetical protein
MTLQEQFDTLTLQDLEDFITNKQEEHLQLDFKTVKHSSLNSADDKKNFAEALSGFANSSGGLVVWGVIAERNSDGVDCAIGKKELDNLPQFISRLNTLTGEAVNPLVNGVKHRAIPTHSNKGFAVTIVPESETTPHMAKCGQNRYYKRSGDSFYQMEHFDLEDMFGRRRKPKLIVKALADYRSQLMIKGGGYILQLSIENQGRGSARSPYLSINLPAHHFTSVLSQNLRQIHKPQNFTDGQTLFERYVFASTDIVIHPTTTLNAVELHISEKAHDTLEPISIGYEIVAEDVNILKSSTKLEYKTRVHRSSNNHSSKNH